MKVLIISAGRYPVPATKGGAVSTLINHLALNNEEKKLLLLEISSPYDSKAVELSKKYKECSFVYIKTPKILKWLESVIYTLASKLLPSKNWTQIKSIFSFLWFIWKNAIILKKNNYDYVIIENTARLYLCFKLFGNKKKYNDKIIYHLHNEPKKLGGCRDLIVESKYIFCISEYIKKCITLDGSPLSLKDSSKAKILKNCVNTSKFKPIDINDRIMLRRKYGLAENDKVLVFSGRIDKEKGIKEVLLAMEYIKTENVKLLVVGSSFYGMKVKSQYEEEIINLAKKLGGRVIFTGFISYEKMPEVYNVADIAVLPSMWEEPAGLTIIEAMACEKAVITTNSGGIPEYTNNECAVLLNRDDNIVRNIAKNIDYLLTNEDIKKNIEKNARQYIMNYFDSNLYLDKMIELLK